jgi:predicted DNA-binding protein
MPEIPKSDKIFDWLSKGNFISSNAVDQELRHYYAIIEDNFSDLYQLYEQVGYTLEEGNNYYYFGKKDELQNSQSAEKKIEKAHKWIDMMAFFITYEPSFTRGYRFSPSEILQQINVNVELKEQLDQLSDRTSKKNSNYRDILDSVLRNLRDEGFIDLENERTQTYKVLDAWHYLEQMVMAVNIREDETDSGEARTSSSSH